MAIQIHCDECGTPLPADAPLGLCPKCVFGFNIKQSGFLDGKETRDAARRQAPAPNELAELLPELEILDVIGQGGMGVVYKARQPSLDRSIAVKVLPKEMATDADFAERFTREAQALAKLNHPNIVSIFDFGTRDGVYYLLMEYVDGVNLRQTLRDGKLEPEEALDIVAQMTGALSYAHAQGIVHRDIKPENILLDKAGQVKLVDFGIAKLLLPAGSAPSLTRLNAAVGTPNYIAPEQLEGRGEVDHRADIYSLGVVFYELLTGELPVGSFPPPSATAQVGSKLDQLVLRTLRKNPSERPQTASDIETEVQNITLDLREFMRFPCPECGKRVKTPRSAVGKSGKCRNCGYRVTVPSHEKLARSVVPEGVVPLHPSIPSLANGEVFINIAGPNRRFATEPTKPKSLRIALPAALTGALTLFVAIGVWLIQDHEQITINGDAIDAKSNADIAKEKAGNAITDDSKPDVAEGTLGDRFGSASATTAGEDATPNTDVRHLEALGYFVEQETADSCKLGVVVSTDAGNLMPSAAEFARLRIESAAQNKEPPPSREHVLQFDAKRVQLILSDGRSLPGDEILLESRDGSNRLVGPTITKLSDEQFDQDEKLDFTLCWKITTNDCQTPLSIQWDDNPIIQVPQIVVQPAKSPLVPSFPLSGNSRSTDDTERPLPKLGLLRAGEHLPFSTVILHGATLSVEGERTPSPGEGVTSLTRDVEEVDVMAKFLRIVPAGKNPNEWKYEIRPVDNTALRLQLKPAGRSIIGAVEYYVSRDELTWLDQPFEMVNREGRVILSSPTPADVGEKRVIENVNYPIGTILRAMK